MIGTKSGKNKIQGLKWESPENVGTKMCFPPKLNYHPLNIMTKILKNTNNLKIFK